MTYDNVTEGTFVCRPNRFTAIADINGKRETVHVKNTGRCRELLIEGVPVYLERHDKSNRKTGWSMIGVRKGERIVNIDSQAPNKAVHEWLLLRKDIDYIKPEYRFGDSRIDFLVNSDDGKALIEVKGVTLEQNGVALFPDAPTERGVKHIFELCRSLELGYNAYIVFVIQMKGVKCFMPNSATHKAFADALTFAGQRGVKILALDCSVGRDYMYIEDKVRVIL